MALPADATKVTYIHFELRSYTGNEDSSFRTLLVNKTCESSKNTCKKHGSTVDVKVPLRFSIDWWTAGLLHPGTYHPYILVMTNSSSVGPTTVELPKVTVTGQLQRAMSCLGQPPVGQCANNAFGYWRDYRAKKVHVYFNPAGSAGPEYRKSLTTDSTGHFRGHLKAHTSGRWFVRFEGNAKHKAKKSPRDRVATT